MTISEYYDKWYQWRNMDIKKLNITIEEYIILDDYMGYVYNLIVDLTNNGYIDRDDLESIIPNMIKSEFEKINSK